MSSFSGSRFSCYKFSLLSIQGKQKTKQLNRRKFDPSSSLFPFMSPASLNIKQYLTSWGVSSDAPGRSFVKFFAQQLEHKSLEMIGNGRPTITRRSRWKPRDKKDFMKWWVASWVRRNRRNFENREEDIPGRETSVERAFMWNKLNLWAEAINCSLLMEWKMSGREKLNRSSSLN